MSKSEKVKWIVGSSLFAIVMILYIVFPTQTEYYFNCVKDFINRPLPIVGISIGVICYFIYKFLKETRYGKKILNKFDDKIKEVEEKHQKIEAELEEKLLLAQQYIEVVEAKAKKCEEKIGFYEEKLNKIAEITPNVKIKAILEEKQVEFADIDLEKITDKEIFVPIHVDSVEDVLEALLPKQGEEVDG